MTRQTPTSRRVLALLVLGSLALASCQTVQTTQPGAVGVERKQVMPLYEAARKR